MKKKIVLGLTAAALASAASALALDSSVTGFYRVQGMMHTLARGNDMDPDMYVSQRLRLMYTAGINEYVKVVYFGELDLEWGDNSGGGGSRNGGGSTSADTVNLETKNLYVWAKFPGTPLSATIGVQGHMDNFDSVLLGPSDNAGLTIKAATSLIDTEIGWYKMVEGDNNASDTLGSAIKEDDTDLYFARIAAKPIKDLKFGGDLYYYKSQGSTAGIIPTLADWTNGYLGITNPAPVTSTVASPGGTGTVTTKTSVSSALALDRADIYWVGLNASYSNPMFGVKGWFLYNWGTMKSTKKTTTTTDKTYTPTDTADAKETTSTSAVTGRSDFDQKIAGYGASVRADVRVAGLNAFVRGGYFSKAGNNEKKIKSLYSPWLNSTEIGPFAGDGIFQLMIVDSNIINGCAAPWVPPTQEAIYHGYGLIAAMLGAIYVPPALPAMYAKGGVGYFRTLDDEGFYGKREGKVLGTEVSTHIGYKFANGAFDLSLNGAYAWMGNYFDGTVPSSGKAGGKSVVANGKDPENTYRLYVQANVPF